MEQLPTLWWMFKTAFFKVMARLVDPAVLAPFFMAVIAVYTAVNAKQQGETTLKALELNQKIFATNYRPWLGVVGLEQAIIPAQKSMGFQVDIKNVGSVPARHVTIDWKVLYNGTQRKPSIEVKPTGLFIIYQGEMSKLGGDVQEPFFTPIMNGTMTLRIEVHISYDGINDEHFQSSSVSDFDYRLKSFTYTSGE